MLWIWGVVAMATVPGELRFSMQPTVEMLDDPAGTIRLTAGGYERIIQGEVVFTAHATPVSGRVMVPQGSCDVDGDGREEMVDHWWNPSLPEVHLRDVLTGDVVVSLEPPLRFDGYTGTRAFGCADVDADGELELVGVYDARNGLGVSTITVRVWNADGSVQAVWPTTGMGGRHPVRLGQLDADPGLELLMGSGEVVDVSTGQAQGFLPTGERMLLHDVDGDGRDEIIERTAGVWRMWDDGVEVWSHRAGANGEMVADFDQDGRSEFVLALTGVGFRVLDAGTGQIIHRRVVAPSCSVLFAVDDDGDGVSEVACDQSIHRRFDPISGRRSLVAGQGRANMVSAGDVDGDGVAELLWTGEGDRAILRDAEGQMLLMADLAGGGATPSLVDVNQDGTMELAVGGAVFDWSPSTGVVPVALPWSSSITLNGGIRHVSDLNGDGYVDLIVELGGTLHIVDGSSGQATALGMSAPNPLTLMDVDGDGVDEILIADATSGEARWVRGDGQVLWSTPARGVVLVGSTRVPTWMACGVTCELYQLTAQGIARPRTTTPPHMADWEHNHYQVRVAQRKIWYHVGTSLFSYDPVSADLVDHGPSWGRSFAFAGGRLWRVRADNMMVGAPL